MPLVREREPSSGGATDDEGWQTSLASSFGSSTARTSRSSRSSTAAPASSSGATCRRRPSPRRASPSSGRRRCPAPDSFVITAPVVGVFRRNAGGKGEAILDEGDAVRPARSSAPSRRWGCSNRIQSERAGVVQEMLVRDGQPVEYGQPLLVVREP